MNYTSLPDAVAAAKDGETVELLKDATGAGVMIKAADAKNITIDFGGHTYTIDKDLVGSTGTESQAFHFEKGCKITMTNGTVTSTNASMLVQNYGDLVIADNMVLDGTKSAKCGYVVSNNCGAVTIKGQLKANEGAYAFDVCATSYYPEGAQVTVEDTAVIEGDIQYDVWGTKPEDNKATLTVNGGKFTGEFDVEEALKEDAKTNIVINDGLFKTAPSDEYVVTGKAAVANLDEATKADYPFTIGEAVARTGGVNYTTLAKAIEVAKAGDTVELLKDTKIETIEIDKKVVLDLGKHEVSSDEPVLFAVTKDGDFTITGNGKITGPENGKAFDGKSLIQVDAGKLVVENGTLTATGEGSDGMYGVYVLNGGKAVFGVKDAEEGPVVTSHFAAIGTNNTTAPADITVYGGTYTANAAPAESDWWSYFCAPVYAAGAGTYDLQGGTFNGYYGISSRYANVEQMITMGDVTMTASSGTQVFVDEQTGSAGTADRHIQATGNTLTLPEVYAWRPISDAGDMHYEVGFSLKAFDFKAESKVYNGAAQEAEPVATPKFENAKVTAEDYTLSYKDADGKAIEGAPVNAGTYTVVAKGTEGSAYEGTESNPFTFEITQADLADCEIAKIDDQEFTGSAITPAPVVTLGDYTLKEGTDYTVSYENNTNVGTATVTLTAVEGGNFKGTNATTFTITAKDISEAVISGIKSGYDYTGSPITDDFTVMLGDTELKADTDYTFEYKENTRTGVATLTVTGTGNYTGSVSTDFRIHGTSINDADVTIEEGPFVYDGTAKTPKVTSVKMTINGNEVTLVKDKDFTVEYTNNVNAGTAQVVLFGKADFSGGQIVEFTIGPAQVEIPAAKEGLVYNGEAQTGVAAAENAPYTLSGNVQTDAGEYAAMAALNSDNYIWKNGKTENQLILWSIAPKEITPVIAAIDDQTHTGEEVTPAVTVTAEGESLTEADYEVAYSNNVEVGEATVTVTMKGNYTGTATAKFNIVHKHTLTEVDAKAATCTEDGNKEYYVCEECGKYFSDAEGTEELQAADVVVAKTGHTEGAKVKENEKAATCTEAGSYDEVVYCTVCGEELSRETTAVEATGHKWNDGTVIKAATCTEAGVKIQKCENDALHLQTAEIPATGHKMTKVDAKDATYTEAGNTAYYVCDVCGEYFEDEAGTKPIADKESVVIPPLKAVASITKDGETAYYGTLQSAIDAAAAGDEVVLLADVTENVAVAAGKDVTLDLNGKTVTNKTSEHTVNVLGKLVVKDSAEGGKIVSTNNCGICVQDGELTFESGAVEAQEMAVLLIDAGKVDIKGGTFTAKDNAVLGTNGSNGRGGNKLSVSGGTFNGTIQTAGYVACGIYAANDDEITVSGGTFNITGGAGIVARAGNVSVTGGEFNTTGNTTGKVGDSRVVVPCSALVFDKEANYPGMTDASGIAVSGGTFKSEADSVATIGDAKRIDITGGAFSDDKGNDAKVPAGKKLVQSEDGLYRLNSEWTVSFNNGGETGTMESVQVVDGKTYKLPENGFTTDKDCNKFAGWQVGEETMQAGDEITVTADVTVTATWKVEHSLTHHDAKAATCTTDGNTENWTCEECGKVFSDAEGKTETTAEKTVVKATGHKWNDGTVIKEATCTEAGVKIQKCENDALHLQTAEIPATGHKMTKVDAKDATCAAEGNTEYYTCSNCGKYFSDEKGETEIALEDTFVEKIAHTWGEWETTTAATCDKDGLKTHTCSVCGESEEEAIPATGHSMTKTDAKAATCTEDGNIEYWTCGTCSKLFSDEEGKTEITEADTVVKATGHSLKKTDAKAATCTVDGNIEYWTCETCGKIFSDAEGKTEITAADTVVKATDHKWNEGTVIKAPTCTEAGVKIQKCENDALHLQVVDIPAKGHKMTKVEAKAATCKAEGNIEYWTCSVCGKYFADEDCTQEIKLEDIVTEKTAHTWGDWTTTTTATCEADGVKTHTCSVCGEVEEEAIPATGHEWGEEETLVEAGCTTFGLTRKICANDDAHVDYKVIEPTGHNLTHAEEKAATCTENGAHEHWYCDKCGKYFSDEKAENEIKESEAIIFATGHTVTKVPAKAATCAAAGNIEYYVCSNCGKYFSDAEGTIEITEADTIIAKKPHALTKVNAKTATHKVLGNIEYYVCSNCGELFLDADGTQPTTRDEVLLKKGWLQESDGWHYYLGNGQTEKGTKLRNGWAEANEGWCWMDENGDWTKSRWVNDKGNWYYIKSDGYMAANQWVKASGGWCYVGATGRMVTNGWVKDSNGWCWMGSDGYWVKNKWIQDKGSWYYINASGYMASNEWVYSGGKWYYMKASGVMAHSEWVQTGVQWYYLKADGTMATGTQTIGGKTYRFDASGRWIQ